VCIFNNKEGELQGVGKACIAEKPTPEKQ